jgi:hypothetical protein
MNIGDETLSMLVGGVTMVMHYWPNMAKEYVPVIHSRFQEIQEFVKGQYCEAAQKIITELKRQFPTVDLMDAMEVVYHPYGVSPKAPETFP